VNQINAEMAKAMMTLTALRFADSADELSRLDAVAGDGDHGVNMAASFGEAVVRITTDQPSTAADVFNLVGQAFSEGGGGSAGALFGAYFTKVGQRLGEASNPVSADFAESLMLGALRVSELGRSALGDKTMIDALQPAAVAAETTANAGGGIHAVLTAAAVAARLGAESTIQMVARSGRARYSNIGAVGTADPGARSVTVLFDSWEEAMEKELQNEA